jgi:outer membrane protein TolC
MNPTRSLRLRPVITTAAAVGLLWGGASFGQTPPASGELPAPRPAAKPQPAAKPDGIPGEPVPITLQAALQLAQVGNLDIARGREVIAVAQANLLRARAQWLPSINLGSTYAEHEGQIQKTEGNIITVNKSSLFVGGGPSMVFQTADALFGPEAARQIEAASVAGQRRVTNDTLLAVADTYFDLLRARRRVARLDEVLGHLTSEQPSPLRGGAKGMLPVARAFVEAHSKEVLPSDLARVEVEVLRRRDERIAAIQDFLIISAGLARLLRLDPAIVLWPTEDFRRPLPLPGATWLERPIEDLVSFALNNRPEMAENQALVQAAVTRVQNARLRPFLPNVALNYNWGDFGGGPDLNPSIFIPPAKKGGAVKVITQPGFTSDDQIRHFKPRQDFDVTLLWRLQNMGFGNRAEVREQEALERNASLRLLQVRDSVVTQVVQTDAAARESQRRVGLTSGSLFDAAGRPGGPVYRSLRLNFALILEAERRPLEVIDSIRGLNDMLDAYATDVTDYERARFRLLVALGLPPGALLDFDHH